MTAYEIKQLKSIIRQCDKISNYVKQSKTTKETFLKDEMVFDAITTCLIQIGEHVNKLSDEFKEKHTAINWHQIRGLRNRMTHDYEGVSVRVIWIIITKNIPELRIAVNEIFINETKN